MSHDYAIQIVQFLVSPSHAYFGRSKDGAADIPTELPDHVTIKADKGITGDRFFGVKAHTEAAVTFLAIEAWDAATGGGVDPAVARRNIVVRGLELDPLRGETFELDTGDGPILFYGGRPAHPCSWMDSMVTGGTRKALIGRGGLRAKPIGSGILRLGAGTISSPVPLDAERAADSVRRAQPLGH